MIAPAAPSSPTVSVVMTVYNTEKYLAEAVESILGQTFTDFEFLIVDDGSTDGSPALLAEFARRDPRVRVITQANAGIVAAANAGIAQARGTYVARMDGDDIALPHRLARQVAYLDAHPDCVLLGSGVMMIDPYGSPVGEMELHRTHEEIEAQLLSCAGGSALIQPSTMMRADALRAVGGYHGTSNIAEDMDLFLRLAERGQVANLPEVLLRYRRHPRSVSQTQYRQQAAIETIVRLAYTRRGKPVPADWKFVPWKPMAKDYQLFVWGWAALKAGNVAVARKHAAAALRARPLSAGYWRLMYCALRGH